MTAAFSVILPHLRNAGNNAALEIAISCLMANTVHDFHLMLDTSTGVELAAIVNRMVMHAPTDCIVYTASDTFFAPGWDVPMLDAWNTDTIVTNVLVEPGAIGLHHNNYHKDFGRKPETFRRAEFEAWSMSDDAPMLEGDGWLAPFMMSRRGFLDFGGLETGLPTDHHGFTGADEALFARWKEDGNTVMRVKSYAYHLQRYSQVDEQMKVGR